MIICDGLKIQQFIEDVQTSDCSKCQKTTMNTQARDFRNGINLQSVPQRPYSE